MRALDEFEACYGPCFMGRKMTAYRFSDGRYHLQVRPARAAEPPSIAASKRVPVFTVPVLDGVGVRGGVFPDYDSMSRHIVDAYRDASDAYKAQTGGCSTGAGGCQFSGPPRIFILLPSSGPSFMPLVVGGSNFDVGTIPYVNSTPSVSIFNFSTRNIPLLGSISVGFTIVPPAAPSGPGDVHVEYFGQRSNPFPFTKN
jgi:hypothetical protein